jgi:preprotein translocase SecE subunit
MATKKKGKDAGKKSESASAKTAMQPKTVKQDSPEAEALPRPTKVEAQAMGQSESKKDTGGAKANTKDAAANKPKGKKAEKKDGEPSNVVAHFLQFLKEVNIESRKITWPERALILRETWGVIVLVTVLTFLVLGFDWAVGHFVFQPLEHWSRILGGGVGH